MSLPASALTRIQQQYAATLPDAATISRVTRTPDDWGNWTETPATIAVTFARIAPISGDLVQSAGALAEDVTATLTFPAETDVRAGDSVTIGARVFDVAYVAPRSQAFTLRCIARETT